MVTMEKIIKQGETKGRGMAFKLYATDLETLTAQTTALSSYLKDEQGVTFAGITDSFTAENFPYSLVSFFIYKNRSITWEKLSSNMQEIVPIEDIHFYARTPLPLEVA